MIYEKNQDYIQHDSDNIKGFFGQYRWLSNFEPCRVIFEGLTYPSSENAYQAAKSLDQELRVSFSKCLPYESKKFSKSIILRDNWDQIKYQIMFDICLDKFTRNPELGTKLIETGDKYLEETNHWGDTYWGVCHDIGQNNLGKILMDIRRMIQ